MTNFIEATKIELKKRTPKELVDKITELATDKIVKDKEIARLNKIINKIKNIVFDKNLWEDEYEGCFKTIDDDFCERYYLLKELKKILKEEGK